MDFAYWLVEAAITAKQRKDWAAQGLALPDGSWPIPDVEFLRKAVKEFGRAVAQGKAGKVKAWIIKRARALDALGELPAPWGVTEADAAILDGLLEADDFVVDEDGIDVSESADLVMELALSETWVLLAENPGHPDQSVHGRRGGGSIRDSGDGRERGKRPPLGTEVVKGLRDAAIAGGMDPEDVAAALEELRTNYRDTGEIQVPKALVVAAVKGKPAKEVASIVRKLKQQARGRETGDGTVQEAEADADSLDERASRIRNAWEMQRRTMGPSYATSWPQEVFDDHVVVRIGEDNYSVPYTDNGEDIAFQVDDAQKVKRTWVTIEATEDAPTTWLARPLTEGDAEADGGRWEVVIIRAGKSKNRRRYPAKVLQESAPLFEGAKVLARSDDDHVAGTDRSVKNIVGWLSEVTYAKGAIRGVLNISETAAWLRTLLVDAWKRGKKDLVGLSIVAEGQGRQVREKDGPVMEIESITRVLSVDVVVEPAAGGEFVRLVAAVGKEEHPMEKLLELLRALSEKPEAFRALLKEATDEQVAEIKEAAPDLLEKIEEALKDPAPDAEAEAKAKAEKEAADKAAAEKLAEAEKTDKDPEDLVPVAIGRFVIREALDETKLPEPVRERISNRFAGKTFREAELAEAIKDELDSWAVLEKVGLVKSSGGPKDPLGSVGIGEAERWKASLDGFFAGQDVEIDGTKIPRFRSFREAYVRGTGDEGLRGHLSVREAGALRLTEANGGRVKVKVIRWDDHDMTFAEAIQSTTFGEILGDSITRKMLSEYAELNLRTWEPLVDSVPASDFRTQRRMRFGGYGNLPAVAQNAAYGALTSPADEEATYAVSKRGGTETITLEAIANDDVGAIRRIPTRLARAALHTLHEFIFEFLAANAAIYDSVALFHATHANLGSVALSSASLKAARLRMRKQADMSNSKRLGLRAANLWVPPDLEDVAFEILNAPGKPGTADNDANFLRGQFNVTVVDYWTDVNNWFMSAAKSDTPLIEVGFFGPEEPELFTQDLPNVGDMFTNDRLVYKIRHIYGGAVMDFRGLDGSIVA